MNRIITLLIIACILLSCQTDTKKRSSTSKTETKKLSQIETPIINSDLIDAFYSNEYLDSLAVASKYEILEEVNIYEEADSLKIVFMQIVNWNDPGDFVKIQIKNSEDDVIFEQVNIDGWMKCVSYYKLPESINLINQISSDKALVVSNQTGKQLVLFGYTYASQPGLMTIIDLFPEPRVIFNKQFDLRSISSSTKSGYLDYIGGTTLSNKVVLNMKLMKIEE